jgi:hypothetical protein
MKLVIPSPEYIMDFAVHPSTKDNDINWGISEKKRNSAKTKQSKRQPNEAIIGDTRFKVDAASGIIIY